MKLRQAALMGLAIIAGGAAEAGTLVPRAQFFGPLERSWPALSPDGRHLAYLAPDEKGVMNLWLAETGPGVPQGHKLSRDSHRGLYAYRWAEDGIHILFWQDQDGDEVFHLYTVDIGTGQIRDLTPIKGVQAQNLLTDPRHPHE